MRSLTPFEDFNRLLGRHPSTFRCLVEAYCAASTTAGDWALLRLEAADRLEVANGFDPVLDYEPPKRRSPQKGTPHRTSTGAVDVEFSRDDPLKRIPAAVYLPLIAGVEVSANGRCRCPMPNHEDAHPSCKVYDTVLWHCFSCDAGSTIIDVGAAVYGVEPTGSGWFELRDLIIEALHGAPVQGGQNDGPA